MTAIETKETKEQKRERKRLKHLKKEQKRLLEEKQQQKQQQPQHQSPGEKDSNSKKRSSVDDAKKDSKKHKSSDISKESVPSKTGDDAQPSADQWYKANDIVVTDPQKGTEWKPILRFAETELSKQVLHACSTFKQPTPIQSACWPIVLKKRDCVGIAETGSGKTLAFGIPALAHLQSIHASGCSSSSSSKLPKVLVLAPTRELAMQISEQFQLASKQMASVKSLCIYGGVPKDEQRKQLSRGVQIVIACPGRLLDLMEEGCCDLSEVDFVVLDEADRMLDMGFEREVRRILAATSEHKQTVMFSATWPQSIVQLANEFLKQPVKVTVGSPDLGANRNITQLVEVCDPREKDQKLLQLLQRYHSSRQNRVLVFVLYKKEAARVQQTLGRKGWNCVAIHGDMNQPERTRNFNQFKSGQVPLLIATDVAARVCA